MKTILISILTVIILLTTIGLYNNYYPFEYRVTKRDEGYYIIEKHHDILFIDRWVNIMALQDCGEIYHPRYSSYEEAEKIVNYLKQ